LVIAGQYPHRSGKDKTSIVFAVKDRVGALYCALEHFDRHDINLTNIQSRPSKKRPWEYIFFIDLQGHIEDEPVQSALEKVKADCLFFKVLGSYPAASSLSG
jgi:chorismate mutase/prephenate dehydratase